MIELCDHLNSLAFTSQKKDRESFFQLSYIIKKSGSIIFQDEEKLLTKKYMTQMSLMGELFCRASDEDWPDWDAVINDGLDGDRFLRPQVMLIRN